ncbi:MAG: NADH-quinone oxidoreductase subunit N [Chitinophagaceae bacterium]|nr:MAG: NADH-quinone oxidoreductase subunit N [Chitinophagaceae bacterium]
MKSELLLAAIIFVLLFIKIGGNMRNESLLLIIQSLLLLHLLFSFIMNSSGSLFDGMFLTNPLIALQKTVLNLGLYLMSLLFSRWLKQTEHLSEFFMLMCSAVLGMYFMISSGNLLMFYLALELATIPVAAMVNFDLDKKVSSEAAMKMILSSAFSSGILLFGISLLYGVTGTINFSEITGMLDGSPLVSLAFIFLFAAFAFKLSVVPFHLWTADVYEGAPFAATSFLSVASKAAIAFIFTATLYKVFAPLEELWYNMLMVLSIATMLVGNLFALRQQNIKRFLAFSSIAQVGFILVGISGNAPVGTAVVVYFVLIYTVSNLAAFGVAAAVAAQTGREKIEDYNGLYQTNPLLSWVLALAMFSLAGIPPTAGFFGKLFLITSGASKGNYLFITIAALNMILSLFYYVKVVRAMFMAKNDHPLETIQLHRSEKLALVICTAGILLLGLFSWVYDYIQHLSV